MYNVIDANFDEEYYIPEEKIEKTDEQRFQQELIYDYLELCLTKLEFEIYMRYKYQRPKRIAIDLGLSQTAVSTIKNKINKKIERFAAKRREMQRIRKSHEAIAKRKLLS